MLESQMNALRYGQGEDARCISQARTLRCSCGAVVVTHSRNQKRCAECAAKVKIKRDRKPDPCGHGDQDLIRDGELAARERFEKWEQLQERD